MVAVDGFIAPKPVKVAAPSQQTQLGMERRKSLLFLGVGQRTLYNAHFIKPYRCPVHFKTGFR